MCIIQYEKWIISRDRGIGAVVTCDGSSNGVSTLPVLALKNKNKKFSAYFGIYHVDLEKVFSVKDFALHKPTKTNK